MTRGTKISLLWLMTELFWRLARDSRITIDFNASILSPFSSSTTTLLHSHRFYPWPLLFVASMYEWRRRDQHCLIIDDGCRCSSCPLRKLCAANCQFHTRNTGKYQSNFASPLNDVTCTIHRRLFFTDQRTCRRWGIIRGPRYPLIFTIFLLRIFILLITIFFIIIIVYATIIYIGSSVRVG